MRYRLQAKTDKFYLWKPTTIMLRTIFVSFLLVCGFCTLHFLLSSLCTISVSSYPTSIPWIDSKSECEHTYRTWRNGKCWDYEHNLMF